MQFKQVDNPRGSTIIIDGQPFVFAPLSLGDMIYMDQLTEVMEAVMSVSGLKGNEDNAAGGSGE